MASKKVFSFVALFALVALIVLGANVTAARDFGDFESIEVKGVEVLGLTNPKVSVFPGENLPIRVEIFAQDNAEDARIKAWISGEREFSAVSERIDFVRNGTYSALLIVEVPKSLDDDELDREVTLNIVVENEDRETADVQVSLILQRESYNVEVLDVDLNPEVKAGELLAVDVVIKNRGRHTSDDTFVTVRIPQLGVQDRAYFGDLTPIDQDDPEKEDSAERRLYLRIPSNVQPGLYDVEVNAFNDETATTVTRKVSVTGAESSSTVFAQTNSRTFGVGEEGT